MNVSLLRASAILSLHTLLKGLSQRSFHSSPCSKKLPCTSLVRSFVQKESVYTVPQSLHSWLSVTEIKPLWSTLWPRARLPWPRIILAQSEIFAPHATNPLCVFCKACFPYVLVKNVTAQYYLLIPAFLSMWGIHHSMDIITEVAILAAALVPAWYAWICTTAHFYIIFTSELPLFILCRNNLKVMDKLLTLIFILFCILQVQRRDTRWTC